MMLLITLLVVFLIYSLYKNNHKVQMTTGGDSRAEAPSLKVSQEILDQLNLKFVNGELTEEEYSRKKDLLLK